MDRFEIPLDIEDVKIEHVEFTPNNEIIITVTSTVEGTLCHSNAIKEVLEPIRKLIMQFSFTLLPLILPVHITV